MSLNGTVLDNRFNINVNGTYSYNFNQPDAIDLNFLGVQRFTLPAESGRPIYVLPTSIDAASGLIASRDARVSPAFNAVSSLRSNLHSQSRQLTIALSPFTIAAPRVRWSLTYAYLNVSQQYRGFSSTVANPLEVRTGVGASPTHDLAYSLSYNLRNAVTFTWGGRLTSGTRFTPTIAGDVNGDGRSNDRAFVFDPATVGDAALATSMRGLLDHGSGAARDCLRRQLGNLASRNSCTGPWTSGNTTLRMVLNPTRIRLPQRTTLSFAMSNPIGAADLLLHGQNRLHGWGQTPFLDQSLLFVRGFDAATSRYKYEVNQRFGSTRRADYVPHTSGAYDAGELRLVTDARLAVAASKSGPGETPRWRENDRSATAPDVGQLLPQPDGEHAAVGGTIASHAQTSRQFGHHESSVHSAGGFAVDAGGEGVGRIAERLR